VSPSMSVGYKHELPLKIIHKIFPKWFKPHPSC
jgi:hypothetical protein